MEVKINNNGEMLDATIEMVDGVMVVSPKEVKFEPKDGDIVTNGNAVIAIFKMGSLMSFNSYTAYYDGRIWINECFSKDGISLATEEEKKRFFVKLAEEGYEFDFEKKELVKLKWKPKEGEDFWFPLYYTYSAEFKPVTLLLDKGRDKAILDKGWYFKTKEECQEFCNRLNQAIEGIKP